MNEEKTRSELRPLFKCPLCTEMLADPVRLRICGHTFCHFCLIKNLRRSRTCPQCKNELENAGHKAYTTDLGLQELIYRCFPDEAVQSMRKKFDLAAVKKPIAYQLCAANLIYLLQHHICAPSEKVRLRICLTNRRIVNAHKDHRDDNREMILRCEHDISLRSIKKLFAQKFQLPTSLLDLFSSDTLSLNDDDTVGDLVLQSGGFDIHTPVIIHACLRDKEERRKEDEGSLPPLDEDMPVLELESYEADAPVLEPELPTTSAQADESTVEPAIQEQTNPVPELLPNTPLTPSFDQKTSAKRKSAFEEVNPAKARRTTSRSDPPNQSPSTPNEFMAFFNLMSSAAQQRPQMTSPNAQSSASTASSIFASSTARPQSNHSESSIFSNKQPAYPFTNPDLVAAFQFQMLGSAVMKQQQKPHVQMPQMPMMLPNFSPQHLTSPQNAHFATLQRSMTDAQNYNEFWTRFLQMNGQVPTKPNIKKPGATVKPIRRESAYKPPAADQRPNKNGSLESFKEGGSGEGDLHQFLTCAKI